MADAGPSGLPEEIIIWEILVRLPTNSLLRCRAVCRSWRRATSTRDFLLAHHARQPTLPLLYGHNRGLSKDIITFDHRAGVTAADQLPYVERLGQGLLQVEAACDVLLIIFDFQARNFCICNPATRQCARLQILSHFTVFGMYRHHPTGDYRILCGQSIYDHKSCCIFTLGSIQAPRYIEWPPDVDLVNFCGVAVMIRGSLHWHLEKPQSGTNMIGVFDTTAESFRLMSAPAILGCRAHLFEMVIDIWVVNDYESEVWAFKCRIELPVEEIRGRCDKYDHWWNVVVAPRDGEDGELLVLVQFSESLLQVDMDGKLVTTFHRRGLHPNELQLKQSLVSHTFFSTLEGYVVNARPFI